MPSDTIRTPRLALTVMCCVLAASGACSTSTADPASGALPGHDVERARARPRPRRLGQLRRGRPSLAPRGDRRPFGPRVDRRLRGPGAHRGRVGRPSRRRGSHRHRAQHRERARRSRRARVDRERSADARPIACSTTATRAGRTRASRRSPRASSSERGHCRERRRRRRRRSASARACRGGSARRSDDDGRRASSPAPTARPSSKTYVAADAQTAPHRAKA